jgi:hypothetical protein
MRPFSTGQRQPGGGRTIAAALRGQRHLFGFSGLFPHRWPLPRYLQDRAAAKDTASVSLDASRLDFEKGQTRSAFGGPLAVELDASSIGAAPAGTQHSARFPHPPAGNPKLCTVSRPSGWGTSARSPAPSTAPAGRPSRRSSCTSSRPRGPRPSWISRAFPSRPDPFCLQPP